MMAEKDEVLNLFYLFEGEDIYVIKEAPQPVMDPASALAEEMPFVEQPVETSASDEVMVPEEPLPLEAKQMVEPTIVAEMTPLAEKIVEETAKEPLEMIVEVMATSEEVVIAVESVVEMPVVSRKLAATTAIPQYSITDTSKADTQANPLTVPSEEPLPSPVVIVISEHRSTALNVYDAAFLEKVLQAVDLPLEKVDIMNVSGVPNPDYSYLLKQKTVRHFITFGVPMESLHLYELLPYEVTFFGGIRFLYADSLEGIRTDIERKKWLWNALKKMFGK